MGGGDLNLKKSWHPSTMRNMEKVWKAEKKDDHEKRKIAQLQREIQEEKAREDLQKYAEEKGVVEKKDEKKLEWMYKGPRDIVDREEYLLGRKVDKTFEELEEADKPSTSSSLRNSIEHGTVSFVFTASNQQVDLARKLQEDPLYAIKKKEIETKNRILSNPVKVKQLQKLLKQQERNKKLKKSKKKKKHVSSDSNDDLDKMLLAKYSRLKSKLKADIQELKDCSSDSSNCYNGKIDSDDGDKLRKRKLERSSLKNKEKFINKGYVSRKSKDISESSDSEEEKDKQQRNYRSQEKRKHSSRSSNDKDRGRKTRLLSQTRNKIKDSADVDNRKLYRGSSDKNSNCKEKSSDRDKDKDILVRVSIQYKERDLSRSDSEYSDSLKNKRYEESLSSSKLKKEDTGRHENETLKYRRHKQYVSTSAKNEERALSSSKYQENDKKRYENKILKNQRHSQYESSSTSNNEDERNYKNKRELSRRESGDDMKHCKEIVQKRSSRSRRSDKSDSTTDCDKSSYKKKNKELLSRNSSRSSSNSSSDSTSNDERSHERGLNQGYGLVLPESKKHVNRKLSPDRQENVGNKKVLVKQEPVSQQKHHKKQKLSEEELERRRQEMMSNAKWRESVREVHVARYKAQDKKEKKEAKKFDTNFLRENLAYAASQETVEKRIKSNIYNIQRSHASMDKNFARR